MNIEKEITESIYVLISASVWTQVSNAVDNSFDFRLLTSISRSCYDPIRETYHDSIHNNKREEIKAHDYTQRS